ncbi:MAG: hypothetical protein KDK70_10750 [Myxococcales bacterium]|nr:hypothetical protein [Myxococcales bacterium]
MLRRLMCLPVVCALASCTGLFDTTYEHDDDEADTEAEPEPWRAEVLAGTHHLGVEAITNWPPPEGACIEGEFVLEELPADPETGEVPASVVLSFQHAGDRDGLIELNGTTVFTRVRLADILATALADLLVDITVCTITSALPGDPDCDPIVVDVETTWVSRSVPTEALSIGTNTYRVCTSDGDFLVAAGIELHESSSSDDDGETDTDTDTDGETDTGADTDTGG